MDISQIIEQVNLCDRCRLRAARTHAVPGEGSLNAKIMFVGEGPGQEEDRQGRPFVGASGELLTKMIHAIGMERTECYIANVVKCRPPMNRNPAPDEIEACIPFLRRQTAIIRPKIIVTLGKVASNALLHREIFITRDHGTWFVSKGVYMMPTYHPSALLRDPSKKRDAWEDFKKIRDKLSELNDDNGTDRADNN